MPESGVPDAVIALIGLAALSASLTAAADGAGDAILHALVPSGVFVQAGEGDQDTKSYIGGLTWEPSWQYKLGATTISGYFEAAFGKWVTRQGGAAGNTWLSQTALTPVLRLRPDGVLNSWFAEVGVGANFIIPVFETGHKRFSTNFNFGDHLGIGRDLGPHEMTIRVQHFSNAGIEHPNPGENFVQLRYAYRFAD